MYPSDAVRDQHQPNCGSSQSITRGHCSCGGHGGAAIDGYLDSNMRTPEDGPRSLIRRESCSVRVAADISIDTIQSGCDEPDRLFVLGCRCRDCTDSRDIYGIPYVRRIQKIYKMESVITFAYSLVQGPSLLEGIYDLYLPQCADPSRCWDPSRVAVVSTALHMWVNLFKKIS